jgi:LmbE family N-acetylglucosaminyl deacetylase
VVFLHAHPDDEAIFTGGTMALLSARGVRVVVVVATSGELGRRVEGVDGDGLAALRRDETRRACAALGADRVEFLGYRDSGLPGDPANHAPGAFFAARIDDAAAAVAEILRQETATAIVVYDAAGVYGHPDHIRVHEVGVQAAATVGLATVYQATLDREYLHFVETHLVDHAQASVGHLIVGVPSVLVTTMVDVRSVLDAKRHAIAAHASQVPESSYVVTMPAGTFAEVYGFEWYVREGPRGEIDALSVPFE